MSNTKLSLLICTMPSRASMLQTLQSNIQKQAMGLPVEICINADNASIGQKRNALLAAATGEYVAFIDDDDIISENYIRLILAGLEASPDCCSLKGVITFNGSNPKTFIHSVAYDSYFESKNVYYRPPNHLNTIKSSIAKQFIFPDINFSEDTNWAMQIAKSKLLKNEYKIEDVLYYYKYIPNKKKGT